MTLADKSSKGRGALAGVLSFLAVTVYSGWAIVQILVLNPLWAVPGTPLRQIYTEVEAAGQSMDVWLVVSFLAFGPLAMLAIAFLAAARPLAWWIPSVVGLGLLTLGPLAYWWASVAPAIGLADTYFISGGDHSPWAWPLVVVSALALLGLVVLGVRGIRWSRGNGAPAQAPYLA
ncbi:hypothetical protein [Demequina zhanjiangensis]|uniref:Uncharacterized protein n=1 Tax=Demequina zhanjiangensis TaxID=3051659 RepID=A0ABT8G515_9MICO|nr:hypothetical protein [Demequina sp. SYSU T00b26]MDN4474227.1 hypothetical protein [Demequina sp. SYSU T00b26]